MRAAWLVFAGVAAGAMVWLMRTPAPPGPLYPIEEAAPAPELGKAFDPGRCGSIVGRVVWAGPEPRPGPVPVFEAGNPHATGERPNPNAPRLTDSGVADAVVWLRAVDPARSKPWDRPPVTVEVGEPDFVVRTGEAAGKVGIVRRGEAVTFVAREARLHSVRGRGPVFFTQTLTEPDRAVSRTMDRSGVVELSSGSGYHWMRAYLAVSDHPYVAVTPADGSFGFDAVPDGPYELVCWKANFHLDRFEHDPETIWPVRLLFHSPVEVSQSVRVAAGGRASATFTLSTGLFGPR